MSASETFEGATENDVREIVIRPLLERLGYDRSKVMTQLPLRYTYLFLGHRKGSGKDRPLRGEADYVVNVDQRLRWVVEAKRGGPITDDDREQAYSYAMHPEVRAVVFAIISGTHYEFFSTFETPEAGPILSFNETEAEECFAAVQGLVSAAAMASRYAKFSHDSGKPLGTGLRSFAQIQRGYLLYTSVPKHMTNIAGLKVFFENGSVVREKAGGIRLLASPLFPTEVVEKFAQAMDVMRFELWTASDEISADVANPTIFNGRKESVIAAGTQVPDGAAISQSVGQLTRDFKIIVESQFRGTLRGRTLSGPLVAWAVEPKVDGVQIEGWIEAHLN